MINKREKAVLFVSVGRLVEEKGYQRLLKCCEELNLNGYRDQYDLRIIGSGSEEEQLKRYIADHELTNVKLMGFKTNPYPYMKMADWYVCSSRTEGSCVTIQEALALRIPVLTTLCPGAVELFDQNMNGIVVENSREGIYLGMKRILDNPNLSAYYKKEMEVVNATDTFESRNQDIVNLM